MIEIIGTDNREEKELPWRNLPKNLRQIGEPRERLRIYMEDYVMTYLGRLASPDQVDARGAILFGKRYQTEEGPALFINGAVEAQNLEMDMDDTVFDDDIWEDFVSKGETYFPEQEVAGWFLSRMGFSVEINEKIRNLHLRNFSGENQVLYMMDSLEKEDAMYLYENGQMKKQKGYYIYYEKNSGMQEYMLSKKGSGTKKRTEMEKQAETRRDRKVIGSYRKISRYSREKKKQDFKIRMVRAACTVLILVMGTAALGQMNQRRANKSWGNYAIETFQAIKENFGAEESLYVIEEIKTGDLQRTEYEAETVETQAVSKPLYYIVQKGDTLAAISRKMYSSDKYAEQIAQANGLSNANQIYIGQEILIPSLQ